jgi:hypothetical protein
MGRVDDEEVHGAHVAAGDDRRAKDEDRPTDHLAPNLGDEDAGLGEIDELAEEIGGVQRMSGAGGVEHGDTERDETIDVGDPSRSDEIFHAGRCTSAV